VRQLDSSVRYFLVHKLRISNKKANELICSGKVLINNLPVTVHQKIYPEDCVVVENREIRPGKKFIYWKYYKPRGIETTLNREIPGNLHSVLTLPTDVFPVGRLDKESEGLLILSNDGRIFNKTLMSGDHEKEYLVQVDQALQDEQIARLASGIVIMGYKTRPCQVTRTASHSFRIILTEGKNRQIRRMCHKLNLNVLHLTRTRIMNITTEGLFPGLQTTMTEKEKSALFRQLGL